jgi:hypothetical protein
VKNAVYSFDRLGQAFGICEVRLDKLGIEMTDSKILQRPSYHQSGMVARL